MLYKITIIINPYENCDKAITSVTGVILGITAYKIHYLTVKPIIRLFSIKPDFNAPVSNREPNKNKCALQTKRDGPVGSRHQRGRPTLGERTYRRPPESEVNLLRSVFIY